jgi:carboxypeptidase Q
MAFFEGATVRARTLKGTIAVLILAVAAAATAWAQAGEPIDLEAVYKIKDEGLQRSEVMETLSYLTDIHGPRLTNSPNIRKAADWTLKRLTTWGVSASRLDTWGPFGRGWSNEKFTANVVSPQPFPLIAFAKAWTPGTNGIVSADAVMAVIQEDADYKQWTGKLKGKIVLAAKPLPVKPLFEPTGRRFTDTDLAGMELQPIDPERRDGRSPNFQSTQQQTRRRMEFFAREGVVAVLEPGSGRNDHGAILVGGSRDLRDAKAAAQPPQIVVATEHYGRIARTLEKNLPVKIELNVQNQYHDETLDSFNILGEIPGTGKADEVVMLGAHFDSWHAGTGATDNAAGSAAMMEAMRILKASGVKMRRTVRLALWTGEEQGLLGARAYVKQQFGDPETMQLKAPHAKLAAYFNMDNGTGAIRGVYMQGNEAVRPIFTAWMAPFRNLGMTTLTIRNTGSTDHVAFDEVGLPGFQFIQDPVEYGSHSHHTNMDLYERIQPADMMKNAVIIASFVYHAANRDDLLPRKTLPKPRAPRPTTTAPQ